MKDGMVAAMLDAMNIRYTTPKWCRRCGGKHGGGGCRLRVVETRSDGAKVYRREGIA